MESHYFDDEIESIFNKEFNFHNFSVSGNPWKLPSFYNREEKILKSYISNLESIKLQLNNLKKSLNDFDIIKWNKHTTKTNPAGYINCTIKRNFHPELCTQAWCKFHELLSFGNVIPEHALSTRKLNAIHLCEAPGAFIASLNHYLRSHHPKVKYKWIGNTLNPYYEGNDPESCIGDDRLIFETSNSWCFGRDHTGDIFSNTVLQELQEKAIEMGIIHLVTADGSINCQECPENQEKDTMSLKYAELFYSLTLLCPGGCLVMKSFTMFEVSSVVLMYILCCTFANVSVRKPATSKPGNSELYVIARNYHGKDNCAELLSNLERRYLSQQDHEFISICDLPEEFLTQHEKCVEKFVELQMKTIQQNKELYGIKWFTPAYEEKKQKVCDAAMELMKMKKIQQNQCLLKNGTLRGRVESNIKLRPKLVGSYSQRHSQIDNQVPSVGESCPVQEKSRDRKEETEKEIHWNTCANVVLPDNMILLHGKALTSIKMSLFCDTDLLMVLHKKCKISSMQHVNIIIEENSTILHTLCQICSKTHGDVHELSLDESCQSTWTKVLTDAPISSLRQINAVKLGATDSLVNCSLLLISLIDRSFPDGCFRELEMKNLLAEICLYISKFLQHESSIAILMPSILTRYVAGLIWMLCQCFSRYAMLPHGQQILLICQGKRESNRLTALMTMSNESMKEIHHDKDVLQIVPHNLIFQDKVFVSTVRKCNHSVAHYRLYQSMNFIL